MNQTEIPREWFKQFWQGVCGFEPFEVYPAFKAVFVGGCIERGVGSSFRAKGHVHSVKADEHYGVICIRSADRLFVGETDRPSQLMLELVSFLISGATRSTKRWQETAKAIGVRSWQYKK